MRKPIQLFSILMSFALALMAGITVNPTAAFAAPSKVSSQITDPYAGQEVPFTGQAVTLTGDLGSANKRSVVAQYYKSKKWKTYAKGSTDAEGNYSFQVSTTSSSRKFRVYAAKSGSSKSVTSPEVTVKTQADTVTIDVMRLGNQLLVSGSATPVFEGREFTLQVQSGSKWNDVETVAASAKGELSVKFDSQGSKSYRWVGAPVLSATDKVISKGATSNTFAFKADPAVLGQNVIYATTDNGGTPTVKGKIYTGKVVLVSDGKASDPVPMEISVRGNSTAKKTKKPYKLKFENKKTGIFGLKGEKTWALLANYVDRSLIRTRVALELGRGQDGLGWTSNDQFAELYLNGKYQGSYQVAETIKISKSRFNLGNDAQIMEHDPHYGNGVDYGFRGPSKMHYSFKDPDGPLDPNPGAGDLTTDRIAKMTTKILQFEQVLYTKDWSKITADGDGNVLYAGKPLDPKDDWTTYLDMKSAADYILVREFTKDHDADFYRSNFFYTKNYLPFFTGSGDSTYKWNYKEGEPTSSEKFYMGPVWDFDRSAGGKNVGPTGAHKSSGWWTNGDGSVDHNTNKIHWFTRIWKDPRFVAALKARWAEKKADYEDVSKSRVDAAVDAIGWQVAVNDRALWTKESDRYKAKASNAATKAGYLAEVAWVKNWYKERYAWMDSQLKRNST